MLGKESKLLIHVFWKFGKHQSLKLPFAAGRLESNISEKIFHLKERTGGLYGRFFPYGRKK